MRGQEAGAQDDDQISLLARWTVLVSTDPAEWQRKDGIWGQGQEGGS